ncbi:glycosyltransferase family 4 protein, partial [Rhizobium ruizarguesonis]
MTLKATTSLPDARAFLGDAPVMAKRRVAEAGGASDTKQLRVAIVHYWLVSMRGGEKVFEELCRMFPQADIFTLVCNRDRISDFLKTRNIR